MRSLRDIYNVESMEEARKRFLTVFIPPYLVMLLVYTPLIVLARERINVTLDSYWLVVALGTIVSLFFWFCWLVMIFSVVKFAGILSRRWSVKYSWWEPILIAVSLVFYPLAPVALLFLLHKSKQAVSESDEAVEVQ